MSVGVTKDGQEKTAKPVWPILVIEEPFLFSRIASGVNKTEQF